MPASDNQVEVTEPATEQASNEVSAKELAAMEEALAARRKQAVDAAQQEAKPPEEERPEPLISLAAKGRDHLMDKLREHMNKKAAEPKYEPPPRTERQMAVLSEEQLAGQRALERHAAFAAANPPPPPDTKREGFSTPAFRPSNVVPDPTIPSGTGFAAGNREFGRNAP